MASPDFFLRQTIIRTFPLAIHDERNPEDIDSDGEDHALDSLRYGLMSRPKPSATPEQIADRTFAAAMKRKKQSTRSQGKYLFLR